MADISDIADTLIGIVAAIVYPNGTANPPAAGCPPMVLYQGWPLPQQLQTDLQAGKAHINVYPRPEEHNVTRYPRAWRRGSYVAPTLTLTYAPPAPLLDESGNELTDPATGDVLLSQSEVTIGGAVGSPFTAQNLAVVVAGIPYVYAAQANDTPTSIATALATKIATGIPGTVSNAAVIALPIGVLVEATRVGGTGTLVAEVSRQDRLFQIGIWAPTPAFRTAIASAIDPVLKGMDFVSLPDGTFGRLIYKSSPMTDGLEKEQLYRRDLMYSVEYATLQTAPATEVVAVELAITPQTIAVDTPVPDSTPEFVTVIVNGPSDLDTETLEGLTDELGLPLTGT